jgi:hypothetical protein
MQTSRRCPVPIVDSAFCMRSEPPRSHASARRLPINRQIIQLHIFSGMSQPTAEENLIQLRAIVMKCRGNDTGSEFRHFSTSLELAQMPASGQECIPDRVLSMCERLSHQPFRNASSANTTDQRPKVNRRLDATIIKAGTLRLQQQPTFTHQAISLRIANKRTSP